MNLTDIISISITSATRTPSRAGFGIPMVTSFTATWPERTRTYSSLNDVVADFPVTTAEYKACAAIFAQNPCPQQVIIGRCTAPTMTWDITPTAVNNATYALTVNGVRYAYTADGSATVAEIITGLKALIDAASLAITISNVSSVMHIVANVAGAWFSVGCTDPNLVLVQSTPDAGIAADLVAITAENNTWYALVTTMNSQAIVKLAAVYALANKKLYIVQTQDGAVPNTAKSGTDDIAEYLQNLANGHVSVWFSNDNSDFLDAGLLGALLPLDPGSENWAFKTLAGVPAGAYTSTQRANLLAKSANFYEPTAGINITWNGKVSSAEWIDVIRFIDWLEARLAEEIFGGQINTKKIPYTTGGLIVIAGFVKRVLKQAANKPIEGITPDFIVTVPNIADVSPADKAARVLNNVTFSATLTGAINTVNLQGNVSV